MLYRIKLTGFDNIHRHEMARAAFTAFPRAYLDRVQDAEE